MAVPEIESRVAALEAEMARLKEQLGESIVSQRDWLDEIYGVFDKDPIYEKAMRLGRKYRKSLRPQTPGKLAPQPRKKPAKARER